MTRRIVLVAVLLGVLGALGPHPALAQISPSRDDYRDLLSADGTDDLAAYARPAPRARPPAMRIGPVLTALPAVSVAHHEASIAIRGLEGVVRERVTIRNAGTFPSDITFRVPVVAHAEAHSVEGSEVTVDSATRTLVVTVPGARAQGETTFSFEHTFPVEVRGGMAHLRMPARPRDARATSIAWTFSADEVWSKLELAGAPVTTKEPRRLEPWLEADVVATLVRPARATGYVRCEDGSNARRVVVARPAATPVASDVVLLVDASPSMEGTPRNRLLPTLTALLAEAPADTAMSAVVFATRAEIVTGSANESGFLERIAREVDRARGSGTRPEVALRLASHAFRARARPRRWVLIGDGQITRAPEALRALERIAGAGEPLFVFDLSDAPIDPALEQAALRSGGAVVRPGDRAGETAMARIAYARRVGTFHGQPTFAGESAERVSGSRSCLVRAPATVSDASIGKGVPAETVLKLLRERVIPPARQCFRSDRKGRGDYSVRATYEFTLRNREVEASRVSGALEPALRSCLWSALETLDVPRFSGSVVVRYPVFTAKEPPTPVIEISDATKRSLDAIVGDQPTKPPSVP